MYSSGAIVMNASFTSVRSVWVRQDKAGMERITFTVIDRCSSGAMGPRICLTCPQEQDEPMTRGVQSSRVFTHRIFGNDEHSDSWGVCNDGGGSWLIEQQRTLAEYGATVNHDIFSDTACEQSNPIDHSPINPINCINKLHHLCRWPCT